MKTVGRGAKIYVRSILRGLILLCAGIAFLALAAEGQAVPPRAKPTVLPALVSKGHTKPLLFHPYEQYGPQ